MPLNITLSVGYHFRYLRMVGLRPLLAGYRSRYPRCVWFAASIAPSLSLLGIVFDTCEWLSRVFLLCWVSKTIPRTHVESSTNLLGIENDTYVIRADLEQMGVAQLFAELVQKVLDIHYATCRWSLCAVHIVAKEGFVNPHRLCNLSNI